MGEGSGDDGYAVIRTDWAVPATAVAATTTAGFGIIYKDTLYVYVQKGVTSYTTTG